jgi:hypothetical protein
MDKTGTGAGEINCRHTNWEVGDAPMEVGNERPTTNTDRRLLNVPDEFKLAAKQKTDNKNTCHTACR